MNFGYNPNNTIKGSVYRDDNRSSSRDGSEEGYQGQTVQLLDKDGNVVATTTTAADGSYSFEHLPDGTYSVKVVKDGALTDTEQTEDPDGTKDNASEPITLDPTQSVKEGVNFGYVPDYSISGLVYNDANRNGSHDGSETPYAGVTVNLLDSAGNVVATTTTDANGAYSFTKLPAGYYTVKVVVSGDLANLDQTEDPDGIADSASGVISLSNDHRTQSDVNFGYAAKIIPPAPQPPSPQPVKPNPKTPGSKLARTGAEAGVLSAGLVALIAGGALLALRRRGRIS